MEKFHATTILGVRIGGKVALGGDGQVTFGDTVMKHSATKIRTLFNDTVLAGFAGAAADAFALFEKFEGRLEEFNGDLVRAAVELAKEWRLDKYLRQLEAMLVVMDKEHGLIISGTGDVLESDDGVLSIGSGSPYATAAARAFIVAGKKNAREIVQKSMEITGDICIYTNRHITVLELKSKT
ncbi:MAG TPA: HslU--HslV peptidase proteolytic subunit [Candidatus Marinimicrobia bacterium]|nr:MAG: HslU--HslV peptidase proteolytic subunit [Candidatus Marinimicrobia bacterium CG1_02_48_14]PIZ67536.1 MAG: HslU--HslV peptidase proteolytic subunit [Candidatus Marinimicrobia bacterium CG_4_10_14_0_2_um_filter_48_9]PJA51972.1 MAG: HslU--HslV peptidase proteolytic subunit [Candidatus Marinimicrobia bacterium CG_4_9_14_3_um_filter_48_9]HCW75295.1 HslU--HslV peptidase proteolytic subunit [Candidatus Neomarinimicrobiota bacterium]